MFLKVALLSSFSRESCETAAGIFLCCQTIAAVFVGGAGLCSGVTAWNRQPAGGGNSRIPTNAGQFGLQFYREVLFSNEVDPCAVDHFNEDRG